MSRAGNIAGTIRSTTGRRKKGRSALFDAELFAALGIDELVPAALAAWRPPAWVSS